MPKQGWDNVYIYIPIWDIRTVIAVLKQTLEYFSLTSQEKEAGKENNIES